jgi:hypothetical protein
MRKEKTKAAPLARKTNGEKRVRHASRVARAEASYREKWQIVDDGLDERFWLDWEGMSACKAR